MLLINIELMPKFKGFLMLNVRFQLKEKSVQITVPKQTLGSPMRQYICSEGRQSHL